MTKRHIARAESAMLVAFALVIAIVVLISQAPWKPQLVVWSCGGNYESLVDYIEWFESENNCRVSYTAAPVQYLLELATESSSPPDVIVGRAGPGWELLRLNGMIDKEPDFFAVDPFVIITPKGNPAGIQSLVDIGREDVRVAYSPHAMRPRGKCISVLVRTADTKFHPGLVERWLNNACVELQCGRKLCEPIAKGQADAAIVPRSSTVWPELAGHIEIIPIEPKYHTAMTGCRAVIVQCAGALNNARRPDLANRFVGGLSESTGSEIIKQHGYLSVNAPEAQKYASLLKISIPSKMQAWQVHMAERLMADGAYGAALRRFLMAYNVFGPDRYDAHALVRAGECAAAMSYSDVAGIFWQKVIDEFPRRGKLEWDSATADIGAIIPDFVSFPEEHWAAEAEKHINEAVTSNKLNTIHKEWLAAFPVQKLQIYASDPPKNGKRWFATAECNLVAGQYAAATREYLKVLSLSYPSKYMNAARFRIGLCDYLRGDVATAIGTWNALIKEYPGDVWAQAASSALQMSKRTSHAPTKDIAVEMPEWDFRFDTSQQRGMSYGMLLYKHNMPLYAYKEMMKVSHGLYKRPGKLMPEARYRAGVACLTMGKPAVAVMQWKMVEAFWPETSWAKKAAQAIAKLQSPGILAPNDRQAVSEILGAPPMPLFKPSRKTSAEKRFFLAEEFYQAGIFEDDQCLLEYMKVLTVLGASGEENKPFKSTAEYRAGMVLDACGHTQAAQKHFRRVVELYPNSQEYIMARKMLQQGAQ